MILILGKGRATGHVIEYCEHKGIEYVIHDDKKSIDKHRFNIKDKSLITEVVKSPGVPETHRLLQLFIKDSVPVIDEVAFTFRELGSPYVIAITGTNGKSTTTALIGHVLSKKYQTFVGGNLYPGEPFSKALIEREHGRVFERYVIEVSTFQLEFSDGFYPEYGVILNIKEDHLNRHTLEEYISLKLKLAQLSKKVIVNFDDERLKKLVIKDNIYNFSLFNKANAYIKDGFVYINGERYFSLKHFKLPGIHNQSNLLAASIVFFLEGLEDSVIEQAIETFSGLPHRLEFIGSINGKVVINNSMCTNPEALLASVSAFEDNVVLIAGGQEKQLSLKPVIEAFKKVKAVVLFGENKDRLEEILKDIHIPYKKVDSPVSYTHLTLPTKA